MTASQNNNRIIKRHSDERAEILVRDDQIVEVLLRPRPYTRAIVDAVIDKVKDLSDSGQLLVLIIADKNSSVQLSGVRKLYSRKARTYSVAKAYVLHKPFHFLLARLLQLYDPRAPIRFFKDRSSAETWLRSFQGYGI